MIVMKYFATTFVLFFSVDTYIIQNRNNIDWCMYFQRLQIYKPECKFYDELSVYEPMNQETKNYPLMVVETPQCGSHYMYCTANSQCGEGFMRCIDTTKYRECCAPVERQCPKIADLNFRCLVTNPVNWCQSNNDCHTTPQKMCCPTGCNYNICI